MSYDVLPDWPFTQLHISKDMERLQAKGDVAEDQIKALEMDVTGKIMLASWRGTRFEVVQVLREVRFVTGSYLVLCRS